MSDSSRPPGVDRPARRGWLAAVPFALAWMVAAGVLDAPLTPAKAIHGGPQIDEVPVQPASPPATHKDEVFDPTELISV
jgi:hypothetical protein